MRNHSLQGPVRHSFARFDRRLSDRGAITPFLTCNLQLTLFFRYDSKSKRKLNNRSFGGTFLSHLLDETLFEYHPRGLIPSSLVLDALMRNELKYSINTSHNIFNELNERTHFTKCSNTLYSKNKTIKINWIGLFLQ